MAAATPASQSRGYQGFGSFHSENVETLVSNLAAGKPLPDLEQPQGAEEAVAACPVPEVTELGTAQFKKQNFFIDPSWTFINHGAFGGAHRLSMSVAAAWRQHCEGQPLAFIDRQLFTAVAHSIDAAAKSVGCSPDTLTFTPNVTTGINAVLAGVLQGAKPNVYMLDIGYGSVKRITKHFAEGAGGSVTLQHVPLPLQQGWEEALVDLVTSTLDPATTGLAVFDHITSNTGVVMPVARLVAAVHALGVPVLVDGAHAWGSVPLDLAALGADFYVTNGHKWLCCPKGVALLHVRERAHRAAIKAPVISHGWDAGFHSSFMWDGCRDYAPILSVPAQLQWWQGLGPKGTWAARDALREAVVAQLVEAWGGGTGAPLGAYGPMALVQLPPGIIAGVEPDAVQHAAAHCGGAEGGAWEDAPPGPYTSTHAKMVQDTLFASRVEVPAKCLGGWLFLRISFAPYNCRQDYTVLQSVVDGVVAGGGIQ